MGGGHLTNFFPAVIFTYFWDNETIGYLLDITFIFDKYHHG